jgi:hypothetical protein
MWQIAEEGVDFTRRQTDAQLRLLPLRRFALFGNALLGVVYGDKLRLVYGMTDTTGHKDVGGWKRI